MTDILYDPYRSHGSSLLYVTHDLATAYQVAEMIIVLHRGQVVEVGTSQEVIHDPKHPYTQALITAVPSPDPNVPRDLERAVPGPDTVGEEQALFRACPSRAVAGPVDVGGTRTTVAEIQHAVAETRSSGTARCGGGAVS